MSELSEVPKPDQLEIQAVINIAKELVDKNKIVKLEKLFNIAKKRLGLNTQTLNYILKYLLNNKILIEGSKIIKSEVLSNENREAIFKSIKKYPGVNFSALKNNALPGSKIGTGQIIWHLEILMNFRYINKMNFKKFTLYFPYEMAPQHALSYFLLRNKINRKIIKILNDKGSMKQADIPQVINESKGTVYYHIKILNKEKLLISEQISGNLEVRLNPVNKDLLFKIIEDVEHKLIELKKKDISPISDSIEKTEVIIEKSEIDISKPIEKKVEKIEVIIEKSEIDISKPIEKKVEKTEVQFDEPAEAKKEIKAAETEKELILDKEEAKLNKRKKERRPKLKTI